MLEVFLKKYGWVANLVLLAAAAWLLARTVNTAVGAAIRPTPRVETSGGPAAPAPPAFASLDVDKLYPLIGQKPPPVVVAGASDAPPPPRTCSDLMAPPMATSLRAQLVAGIVAEKPHRSVAVVTDKSNGQTRSYGIGDEVMGAKLLSVERIRDERDPSGRSARVAAIVCHDGRKEYVDFDSGGGGGGPSPAVNVGVVPVPPPSTAEAAAPLPPDGVKKTGDNKYEVKKAVLDGTLSNLNSVATQARIVPSFKNGVANGFKVFSIQPNSFYSAIGVENGDVVQKINGYEINSPDKALEIYQKLREARHVTVDLERNGQVLRKEYNVTGQ